jgi:hypothetical protein
VNQFKFQKGEPMTTGDLFDGILPERPPKPAYLSGKRTVTMPIPTSLAALPEWPDYLVETWQHVINSSKFVSFIRTRVGNTPYKGELTATLQDVQLTQSIEDGPTVKAVVENMIAQCLEQMNIEIELKKFKNKLDAELDAEQAKIEAAEAEKIKAQIAQESYEKKLRDSGFMLDDLTQQPLPPVPVDRYLSTYVQRQVDINRQQLYMQTQDKTTPQQRNRFKAPTKADELNRIIEKAFKAYDK